MKNYTEKYYKLREVRYRKIIKKLIICFEIAYKYLPLGDSLFFEDRKIIEACIKKAKKLIKK